MYTTKNSGSASNIGSARLECRSCYKLLLRFACITLLGCLVRVVCCSVLQRVAACCSVLQCAALCYIVLGCIVRVMVLAQHPVTHCHTLQHVATHCNSILEAHAWNLEAAINYYYVSIAHKYI